MVAQVLFGFGAVAYNITQVSLRQAITPERLQGRMNAAMRWIVWGTIPLGLARRRRASQRRAASAQPLGRQRSAASSPSSPSRSPPSGTIREMPEPVVEPTPAQAELAGGLVEGLPLPGPAAADAYDPRYRGRDARAPGDGGVAAPAQ